MDYSRDEKVIIVVDISKKLKNFPGKHGTINLYNDQYLFFEKFKEITNTWINTENHSSSGTIQFDEIGKYFEYKFPCNKSEEPLFVLRHNK